MNPKLFFLTVGYSGFSPKASGTVGTLVSLPIGLAIIYYLSPTSLFLLTTLITILAVKVIDQYEKETGTHDSKQIVIDELAGMWFALSISVSSFDISDLNIYSPVVWNIVLSFLLFRLFDIWKPSLIGKIDRDVKGGMGVMGDDVLAGFLAGLSSGASVNILVSYIL